jgi:hypothetical protein
MSNESGGNGPLPQTVLHEASQQFQRMTAILPESAPDPIRDKIGEVRPVAQIADGSPRQRSVSRSRAISFCRGAMEEIRPYS